MCSVNDAQAPQTIPYLLQTAADIEVSPLAVSLSMPTTELDNAAKHAASENVFLVHILLKYLYVDCPFTTKVRRPITDKLMSTVAIRLIDPF